jgi:hypothetical protein
LRIEVTVALAALAWLKLTGTTWAQSAEAPQPRFAEPERPAAANFEPAPRADEDQMEEIIVTAEEEEWRLPDLGSEWRIEREEQEKAEQGRFQADFLPLYDPETAPRNPDLFQLNKEEERVGRIELFRFKFGGKRSQN